MKKAFALLLCLVLCLGLTTALADTEIAFWNGFTGSDGEILTEIVNRFNETNGKGITVKMDIIPWANLNERLPTAIATGTTPELVLLGNDMMTAYTSSGSLQPIDNFFETMGVDKAEFPEAVLQLFQLDGKQYMIPMQVNSLYLYWNKDLFTAAGLDPDQPPKTWDELWVMAKKLTDPEKNIYGLGIPVQSISVFANNILANGGGFVDYEKKVSILNSEVNKKVFQTIQNAVQIDKVSPLATTGADFDNLLFAGQLAMYINGPWCINGCNTHGLNYGVVKLPKGEAGYKNDLGGCGYCIPTGVGDEKKLAAFEFIKYWNSTEICKEWSVRNGFPPYLASVKADPEVAGNALLTEMASALEYGVVHLKGLANASLINSDVLFPMYERIMNGADVAAELAAAEQAMNALLTE